MRTSPSRRIGTPSPIAFLSGQGEFASGGAALPKRAGAALRRGDSRCSRLARKVKHGEESRTLRGWSRIFREAWVSTFAFRRTGKAAHPRGFSVVEVGLCSPRRRLRAAARARAGSGACTDRSSSHLTPFSPSCRSGRSRRTAKTSGVRWASLNRMVRRLCQPQ